MILSISDAKLCDIQGRIFERSKKHGYDSKVFIESFMQSVAAKCLDLPYDRLQWLGEEYVLAEVADEFGGALISSDDLMPDDVLYWIGYIYRYWHYYTGESSKEIYHQAPVDTMATNYLMFHTMAPALAIEDLKEIFAERERAKDDLRG